MTAPTTVTWIATSTRTTCCVAWRSSRDANEQLVVGTFVRNRPEWDLVALSSLYTGNILFPLDPKTPEEELAHLLRISPPDLMMVSRASHAQMTRVLAALGQHPTIVVADLYHDLRGPGGAGAAGRCAAALVDRPG